MFDPESKHKITNLLAIVGFNSGGKVLTKKAKQKLNARVVSKLFDSRNEIWWDVSDGNDSAKTDLDL